MPACFTDQGNGITRDVCVGLQWERKTGADGNPTPSDLHDVDNRYAWAGRCTITNDLCQPTDRAASTCGKETGGAAGCDICSAGAGTCNTGNAITTVWEWINGVNAVNFAGHNDWRLPSEAGQNVPKAPLELETILNCGFGDPCVDPEFGPTAAIYWSRTSNTDTSNPDTAWVVDFRAGTSPAPPRLEDKDSVFSARAVRAPNVQILALAIDPAESTTLYASVGGGPNPLGVYKTENGGVSWQLSYDRQDGPLLTVLAIGPPLPSPLGRPVYAAGAGERLIIVRKDALNDWGYDDPHGSLSVVFCPGYRGSPNALLPHGLAVDPGDADTVYLGTEGCGIYKRSLGMDGLPFWSPMNTGIPPDLLFGLPPAYAFAIVPTAPTTVYAGLVPFSSLPADPRIIFKSTNGDWAGVSNGLTVCGGFVPGVRALAVPANGMTTTLYAGTWYGLFKTTDGGTSWNPINTGLPVKLCSGTGPETFSVDIAALAVDPTNPDVVYAASRLALFKSEDGGGSWGVKLALPDDSEGFTSLAVDAMNPTTVYAGAISSGVLKTTDGGDHWSRMNTGLEVSN